MTHSPLVQSRHDELVAQGREALLAGDKIRAQALLNAAVELDPRSEEAWMWLSGTHAEPEAMADCLQQVLAINPDNQQAHEGLRWLAETHGAAGAPPENTAEARPIPPAVTFHGPADTERTLGALLEAALHPCAAGIFLGLLRLVSWLRPSTLVLMRTDAGPLGLGSSISIALVTALVHGLAFVLIWLVLGFQVSRLRVNGRGDRFDSLMRSGEIWTPGYLWTAALLLATAGLGLGSGPWRLVAALCWLLVVTGAAMMVWRLWRLLDLLAVPHGRRLANRGQLVFTLVFGALLGLGLAGIVTAVLLG